MKNSYDVIQKVLLTEKIARLSEEANQYAFKVSREANKIEIKRAVEEIFGVKVNSVRTMNRKGKKKRERRPAAGRTADWKRAIVTLKDGDTIEVI